ncbi:PREDICTED: G0/G1 switch protein 2 [Lipotes vexillifer]|uniref:G0/G1 switch protein 2 n=1 Tax=Lipotes vexillifer TaxID=118797 RepID=A0A340WS04_LIPVE|nr:PREDICTED: G0/G1 switch protein 2 [Lipotes vexillifer]
METVQELIPLARELMAQKPRRNLVKLYVVGGVLALFGAVLGLMETLCSPFTAADSLREREAAVAELQAARERKALRARALLEKSKQLEAVQGCRAPTNRLHAS